MVSIHAPARGATAARRDSRRSGRCFNPRARTGRDADGCTPLSGVGMFQSTRPHGARLARVTRGQTHGFNPRAPHGARRSRSLTSTDDRCFNPRARTGRDRCTRYFDAARRWRFNPRARTGRDAATRSRRCTVSVFQSTRPHGARRTTGGSRYDVRRVSIHAPARGATPHAYSLSAPSSVSIHAPARGATICLRMDRRATGFNPRARTGRDDLPAGSSGVEQCQFQSTRPHGARRKLAQRDASIESFQSTRPHGARRTEFGSCSRSRCFNPRARTGRDSVLVIADEHLFVFQSTRPHGARRMRQ